MAEAMSEERLALIGEWIEKVAPYEAYYGSMQRFMRELLAEVKWQGFEIARANQEIETLGAEVEAEHREAEEARAELADARGAIAILRDAGKEQHARAETAERELAELGRVEYEIGIQQPGEDDATPYLGFSEADVRARAAEQGATYVERACRRGKWKAAAGDGG